MYTLVCFKTTNKKNLVLEIICHSRLNYVSLFIDSDLEVNFENQPYYPNVKFWTL